MEVIVPGANYWFQRQMPAWRRAGFLSDQRINSTIQQEQRARGEGAAQHALGSVSPLDNGTAVEATPQLAGDESDARDERGEDDAGVNDVEYYSESEDDAPTAPGELDDLESSDEDAYDPISVQSACFTDGDGDGDGVGSDLEGSGDDRETAVHVWTALADQDGEELDEGGAEGLRQWEEPSVDDGYVLVEPEPGVRQLREVDARALKLKSVDRAAHEHMSTANVLDLLHVSLSGAFFCVLLRLCRQPARRCAQYKRWFV